MSNDTMQIIRDIYPLNRDIVNKLGELESLVLAQQTNNSAMDAIALCSRIAQYHHDEKVLRYHWEDILKEAKRIVQQHQ